MNGRAAGAWFIRVALLVSGSALVGLPAAASNVAAAEGPSFAFQWTGDPATPQPWRPSDWDLIVHSRDQNFWTQLGSTTAQHGPDCGPPPATHPTSSYPDAVFICRNHMMTAFSPGGYGEIEFAPNQVADWTNGPAVISWHQSTFRTSPRDWTDIFVTPFDENLVLPAHTDVDLRGRPRDAIHVEMSDAVNPTTFRGTLIDDFKGTDITTAAAALEKVTPPSAVTRTHFQLEISRTHVRFGIPETGTWWIDRDVPSLKFTEGIIQLGHHSYTPDKECTPTPGVLSCTGNTWHWSDFSVSSAVPFTMLRTPVSQPGAHVSHDTSPLVEFEAPAPPNSHLRFAAVGRISVSFDGGKTWRVANPQPSEGNQDGSYTENTTLSYWVPVPAGATGVTFRGEDTYWTWWWVVDPAVWSSMQPPAERSAAVPTQVPARPPANHVAVSSRKTAPLDALAADVRSLLTIQVFLAMGFFVVVATVFGAGVTWGRRRRPRGR